MARSNPQMVFLYLLLPAIFIIFIYSFIFTKFSTVNQPFSGYQNQNYLLMSNAIVNQTISVIINNDDENNSANNNNKNEDEISYRFSIKTISSSSKGTINTNKQYPRLIQTYSNETTNLWSKTMERRFREEKPKFPLKVIIVPHSHNDPGWLNTYDQYYYHYTYYVLENLVKNLNKYPNMTFVWAEMSFFSRWWDSLTSNKMKENLRKLFRDENRFEIVTGGWVMTDEGAAHYFDMIDQLIEGHQFLRTALKFSTAPQNSWSIDPFGHSGTFPYLLQKSGIHNVYIQRTHYAWKRYLSERRFLEFFWKQPFHDGDESNEFPLCHMSPLHLYSFKYACGPDHNVCLEFDFRKIYGETSESTATKLNETNIEAKARKILKQYSKLGSLFSHNVALVLLGDDFRYNFDIEWQQQYKNYMMLIDYINSNGQMFNYSEITFGTLKDYFKVIQERVPINMNNYPTLQGDFMPYADVYVDSVPSYWTGYFTTRPFFKLLSRQLQHWLRSTEIIYSLTRNLVRQQNKNKHLNILLDREYILLANARQNLALFQHHDGITGTSKDYVMEDYGRRLSHSLNSTMFLFAKLIQYLNLDNDLFGVSNNTKQFIFPIQYKSSWQTIVRQQILKVPAYQDGLRLLLFNTHTQIRIESIKILVDDPFIEIIDMENNQKVLYQVNPIFNNSKLSSSIFEIEFIDQLDPLSLKNYKIITNEDNLESKVTISGNFNRNDHSNEAFSFEQNRNFNLENEFLIVTVNQRGFLEKIYFKDSNITEYLEMSFVSYNSEPKRSGAYLMKFIHQNPYPELFFSDTPVINMYKGQLSSTIMVNYTDIAYSIKLHNVQANIGAAIELKLITDLEDKSNYNNQEVAIRFKTQINNKKTGSNETYRTFFIDSNGYQIFERRFVDSIKIEGNYYPMTTSFFIEDQTRRLTILTSHSHGASSPQDGMAEIMLDRRIVYDDKRGLSEGIMDNIKVQSSLWIVFEQLSPQQKSKSSPPTLTSLAESLLMYLNYPSIVMYSYRSDLEITKDASKLYYRNRYMISPNVLCKYFLLNIRTLPSHESFTHPSQSSLIVLHNRASMPSTSTFGFIGQNICDINSNDDDNRPTNFSIPFTHLFNHLRISSIRQTSLTGLQTIDLNIGSSIDINVDPFQIESYNVTFI